jgi:hypothetical protein
MRRSKDETGPWYWGLEWNKNVRVFGAIAHPNDSLFEKLPELNWAQLSERVRVRPEQQEPPLSLRERVDEACACLARMETRILAREW